jgi:hypothetical protein
MKMAGALQAEGAPHAKNQQMKNLGKIYFGAKYRAE